MIKLKIGTRGEIVIPKKIRESIGFTRGSDVVMEFKDGAIELRPPGKDIIGEMKARAKKYDADVSKWKMGDELYEELADEGV